MFAHIEGRRPEMCVWSNEPSPKFETRGCELRSGLAER